MIITIIVPHPKEGGGLRVFAAPGWGTQQGALLEPDFDRCWNKWVHNIDLQDMQTVGLKRFENDALC